MSLISTEIRLFSSFQVDDTPLYLGEQDILVVKFVPLFRYHLFPSEDTHSKRSSGLQNIDDTISIL